MRNEACFLRAAYLCLIHIWIFLGTNAMLARSLLHQPLADMVLPHRCDLALDVGRFAQKESVQVLGVVPQLLPQTTSCHPSLPLVKPSTIREIMS